MLGIGRELMLRRDGGWIGSRFYNGGVDGKGSKFVAIRLDEAL